MLSLALPSDPIGAAATIEPLALTDTVDPRLGPNIPAQGALRFTSFITTQYLRNAPGSAVTIAQLTPGGSGVFLLGTGPSGNGPVPIADTFSFTERGPQLGDGIAFEQFTRVESTSATNVAIAARVGFNRPGIWKFSTSGITKLLLQGESLSIPQCATLSGENPTTLAITTGSIVSRITCSVNRPAVLQWAGSDWQLLTLTGSDGQFGPALGISTSFAHDTFVNRKITLTSDESIIWRDSTNTGLQGIWRLSPSGNTPLAISMYDNELGPSLGPGNVFATLRSTEVSNAVVPAGHSDFIFGAKLQGVDVSISNELAIFRHTAGLNVPIVRSGSVGQLGPMLGGAEVFSRLKMAASTASLDHLHFIGDVSPSGQTGVWGGPIGAHALLAVSGTDGFFGPQVGGGIYFSTFSNVATLANGEAVVTAGLIGPGITAANSFGMWHVRRGSSPSKLIRLADAIDVDPGPGQSLRIVGDLQSPLVPESDDISVVALGDPASIVIVRAYFINNDSAVLRIFAGDLLRADSFE